MIPVQVYSYFSNPAGSNCNVSKHWCLELAKHFDLKALDYTELNCKFPEIEPHLGEHKTPAPIGIFFGYPSFMRNKGNLLLKHKTKIAVIVAETSLRRCEQDHIENMNPDLICVPSNYCKTLFLQPVTITAFRKRVMLVPHGIGKCYLQPPPGQKLKQFTYFYNFQNSPAGGSVTRKGFNELLEASSVVAGKIPIKLLIKTTSNIEADLVQLKKKFPFVKFIYKYVSDEILRKIYSMCHIYVNPSRAEGFGITPLEAMATGLPVVSTIHTGLTDFLNPENCVQIKTDSSKTEIYNYAVNKGNIVKIDPAEIAKAMLFAYENYENLKKDAVARRESIARDWQWQEVLSGVVKWMKDRNT